ncbi:MAG: bacteriohemerythrin [Bryobacteraceae bacterium]|jgi:hemerythrin
MGLFAWSDTYSLEHPQIDREHQALFAMAEQLHQAMLNGSGATVLGDLLARLINYTQVHFSHEEALMRHHQYRGMDAHVAEHRRLTEQVLDLQRKYAAGKLTITLETMHFLRDWLDHHILRSDQLVAQHIRAHEATLSRV